MCTLPPSPVNCNLSCNCTWQMGTIKPVVRSWLQRIGRRQKRKSLLHGKIKGREWYLGAKWKQKESQETSNVLLSRNSHIVLYRRALNLKEPSSHPSVKQGLPAEGRGQLQHETQGDSQKGNEGVCGERFLPDPVIRCEDRAKKVTGWSIRRQSSVTSTLHGRFWWMLLASG